MVKDERYAKVNALVLQTFEKLGYKTELEEDDAGVQIDAIINGTAFAVYYSEESGTVGYGVIFEPMQEINDDDFYAIVEALREEATVFDGFMEDEEGLLHLEGEVDVEDFTEELLKSALETLHRENGAISKLKAHSYVWEE